MTTPSLPNRFASWRYYVFYGIIALVFVIFVVRLFNLQVIEFSDWLAQAETNRTREISLPPQRGIIYDRNGIVLARNIASYTVAITPASLPDDPADIQNIYRELSVLTEVPVNQGTIEDAKLVAPCVEGPGIAQLVALGDSLAPYEPVKIACNVSEDIAFMVREKAVDWPGVDVQIEPVRDYPTGSLTATVIGFLGPIPAILEDIYEDLGFVGNRDKVGYAGVEASLDDYLIGTPGRRVVEWDAAGQEIRDLQPPVDPVPGDNVVLTIDTRLQQAAEAALLSELKYWNEAYWGYNRISSAVVIAMNPKTGEILAMVQYPTFENNRMARFIPAYYYEQLSQDPRNPLLNFAINTTYAPGSTFKLSTATGALNEGVVTLDQVVEAPGALILTEKFSPTDPGRTRPFVDWTCLSDDVTACVGFGQVTFLQCIAYSSNVCFYKLGGGYEDEIPEGLGILRLKEYARALGYDEASGIELIGEVSGLIPDPTWKRINKGENWSTGDTYIASVGQGYVVATPLQVLMSAATIANDGKLMQPTIVREIVDGEGNIIQPFTPRMKWDVTVDAIIKDYACEGGYCDETGLMKTIQPWVIQSVQTGMRMAATESRGTLNRTYSFAGYPIAVAGKTGTAEYCDDVAAEADKCQFGRWPTHAWTVAYAPFDDPEIVILAFAYNAGEGGSVAAPIVKLVMDAYFEIKAIDIAQEITSP